MLSDQARAEVSGQVAGRGPAVGDQPATAVVYAAPWRRLAAGAVDALLIPVVWYLASFIMGGVFTASSGKEMSADAATLTRYGAWIAAAVAWWLYCIIMERSANQGTLGKMLLGIAVTDAAGKRIPLGRAMARNLAKVLSGALLPVNWLLVTFTGKKQGLHDIVAGSLVVDKR